MVAPTVNASAQVAVRPNRVICFMTKRFARMQHVQTKATSAERPNARDPRAKAAIIIVWKRKINSFMFQFVFLWIFYFIIYRFMVSCLVEIEI